MKKKQVGMEEAPGKQRPRHLVSEAGNRCPFALQWILQYLLSSLQLESLCSCFWLANSRGVQSEYWVPYDGKVGSNGD